MAKGEQPGEGWRQWVMETANTATACDPDARRLRHEPGWWFGHRSAANIDRADADFRRLQELQFQRGQRHTRRPVRWLEDWLRFGRPSRSRRSRDRAAEVAQRRERPRWHRAAAHVVVCAPICIASRPRRFRVPTPRRARAQVEIGDAGCAGCFESDRARRRDRLAFQMTRHQRSGGEHPSLAFAEETDTVALTCWLHVTH